MEAVVTVASYSEPLEAEMAKLRLESAGIGVFLAGENARIMEPGLGPLRLQVAAADEADARSILSDPGMSREAEREAEATRGPMEPAIEPDIS